MGRAAIANLAERIRAVELGRAAGAAPALATGWGQIDRMLPERGLALGAVHEWIGPDDPPHWRPAFSLLTHLASQALGRAARGRLVWIGERAWACGHALVRAGLLERSLFLRPRDVSERVWAVELALRSPAVACVVADGSGLDRVALRRLQLAAEAGECLGLLARPAHEAGVISSAVTRWVVAPAPHSHESHGAGAAGVVQRWTVHLLRCKGVQPTIGPRTWTIERDHATGAFCIPPAVADRPAEAPARALWTG